MLDLKDSVVVFDLDDTLYLEKDYQSSGYRFIRDRVLDLYQYDVSHIIEKKGIDVLKSICRELNLPESSKESLLWLYRLHSPDIKLACDVYDTLLKIQTSALRVAILTDGRSVTQRLKLSSLNLGAIDVYISEEWQQAKPGKKRFKAIMERDPNVKQYIYVGDNLKKDFLAPNELGWLTIGLLDQGGNIHSQNIMVDDPYRPNIWINSIKELQGILC